VRLITGVGGLGSFICRCLFLGWRQHNNQINLARTQRLLLNAYTQALAEFDSEVRFKALAATGNKTKGLKLLDKLDRHFSS